MTVPLIYSAAISSTSPVGASSGEDPLSSYQKLLKWVSETDAKLPGGQIFEITPQMREDAYNIDPLLKGTIIPYMKNTLLSGGSLKTSDNKKYEAGIKEIESFHAKIKTLEALRYSCPDYISKHGKQFLRCDPSIEKIESFVQLDNKTITVYEDPFDPSIKAYHQKIYTYTGWNRDGKTEEVDSWWIPGIPAGAHWSEKDKNPKTDPNYLKFKEFMEDYSINDTQNLRLGSADDIIALTKPLHIPRRGKRPEPTAPIDACLLAIWLKRLMLVQSPNIIFRVLAPVVQIVTGTPIEVTENGETSKVPTAPPVPNEADKVNDPDKYAADLLTYQAYTAAVEQLAANWLACIKDGGALMTGPDTSINTIESGRSVPSDFIDAMVALNNKEIGQAHGFPISIVDATGSELATSRSIRETLNISTAGEKLDFESVFDKINNIIFAKSKWTYEIELKDGTVESGSYTYADMGAHWELSEADTKDELVESQTLETTMKAITLIKSLGAGKSDIQAVIDENTDIGVLDLDRFDEVQAVQNLPVTMSAKIDDIEAPSGIEKEDVTLASELVKAYKNGQKQFTTLLEEHAH